MAVKRLYNTNESIIEGLRLSDDDALRHLYKIAYPVIKGMVLKNSGNIDDVDDIFQDGVIALYENVREKEFYLSGTITTYLYSVCRNLWLNKLKAKKKSLDFYDTLEVEKSDTSVYEKELFLTKRQELLADALSLLGNPCHSILSFFYYDRLSMDDIASRLGYTNAANAKNQKYKCLERLKSIMNEKMKAAY